MSKHVAAARPKPAKGSPKKNSPVPNISLAPTAEAAVTSESEQIPAAGITPAASPVRPARSMNQMELTLTRSKAARKSQRLVIYNIEGRTGSVQFLSTLFGGDQKSIGNPPESLKLVGEFAEPKPKAVKITETKEERKARLAALPKPTLAEKVAKAEERAAKLRQKLAAAAAAPAAAEQPVA